MRIVISGIPIDVQKKNIKNMHLQVKPPDGHVVISAPLSVDDKAIEAYARTQLGFIKRAIAQFQDQPRASKRQYVSGETMYIWGKQYFLVFKPDNQKNSFEIQNQNIVLCEGKRGQDLPHGYSGGTVHACDGAYHDGSVYPLRRWFYLGSNGQQGLYR